MAITAELKKKGTRIKTIKRAIKRVRMAIMTKYSKRKKLKKTKVMAKVTVTKSAAITMGITEKGKNN